jgi:phage host-nuclease inhibitor protein Gam
MSLPENSLQTQETREAFVIQTKEQASWVLRKLAKIRKEMAENQAVAEAEIKRTKKPLEEVNGSLEKEAEYFANLLQVYHRTVLEENPKAKTIKLPFGTLKARQQQPEYVRDEEKLLAWTKQNRPDAVKVKESVDWTKLKETISNVVDGLAITEDGEVIEGVKVVERGVKFTVEVDE